MSDPLVEQLGLQPHPEGGWYAETWRSPATTHAAGGERAAATAILYLLEPGQSSAWHRVSSDELWLHHRGEGLELGLGGTGARPGQEEWLVLGAEVDRGQRPQLLVPAGCWQTARPAGAGTVLVSCVVSPGFDFADFELADPAPG